MQHDQSARACIRPPGIVGRTRDRIGIVALGAVMGFTAPAGAQPVELREVRQNLFASCMVSDTQGWIVGELGRIFRTKDAGKSWERQKADTQRPMLAMACLDDKNAWLAGTQGQLYKTTDGGTTWGKVDSGSDKHVFTLQFPTPLRGHGAGDFGRMIHTEDGGKTWTKQQMPTEVQLPESALDTGVDPGDVNIYGLSYGTPDEAWLVGEFGIVIHSSDGGLTWKQQKTPVETTLFGVYFKDAHEGWVVGADAVILHTSDGGGSWQPQTSPITARPLYDVAVRGQTAWVVGESGAMLKSSDGGATWQLQELPIQLAARWIRSIAMTGNAKGFAVGAEGLVFRLDGATAERLSRVDDERHS